MMRGMRPSIARALMLATLLPLHPDRGDFGSVTCSKCSRMMPAIDARGSYHCSCGHACYVEPGPVVDSPR
jgi:hypothetical protein